MDRDTTTVVSGVLATPRCVAVGGYRNDSLPDAPLPAGTRIEPFSGGKWTTNASPGQGGLSELRSVSCPTVSRCYAVGASPTSPDPLIVTSHGLSDVSCAAATQMVRRRDPTAQPAVHPRRG